MRSISRGTSPNQTMWGRTCPRRQTGQRLSASMSPGQSRTARQLRQRALSSSPCMCTRFREPARSWRSSTFWVTRSTSPAPLPLQPGQGQVGGVGLDARQAAPALVVEAVDQGRVAVEGLGCGHVLHPVVLPQPVRVPERAQPAFRGNARAGEDDDGGRRGEASWRSSGLIEEMKRPTDYHQDTKETKEEATGVGLSLGVLVSLVPW